MKTPLKLILPLSILFLGLSFSTSLADCCEFTPYTPSALEEREQVFTDIPIDDEDYWFTKWTHENEIFLGYPDGSFKKENPIKRAELMAVVVRMMGIEPSLEEYDNCFDDVVVTIQKMPGLYPMFAMQRKKIG